MTDYITAGYEDQHNARKHTEQCACISGDTRGTDYIFLEGHTMQKLSHA